VALNHPGRWNWNKAQRLATFVQANNTKIIEDNYFYLMKGFFIAKKGNTTGPNLAQALPPDPLTLTARVYNYSLKTTMVPVHVSTALSVRHQSLSMVQPVASDRHGQHQWGSVNCWNRKTALWYIGENQVAPDAFGSGVGNCISATRTYAADDSGVRHRSGAARWHRRMRPREIA
jgi:hypothetical protein